MLTWVVGGADGVTEREIGEDEAGHTEFFDDVSGGPDDERGDAGGFEHVCGQTDRLVTDRSKRCEHDEVDLVVLNGVDQGVRGLGGLALAVDGGNPVEPWGDAADHAILGERDEVVDREKGSEVVGVGCLVVPVQMVGDETRRDRKRGSGEGFASTMPGECRRGDESDACLLEGGTDSTEGDLVVDRPGVGSVVAHGGVVLAGGVDVAQVAAMGPGHQSMMVEDRGIDPTLRS